MLVWGLAFLGLLYVPLVILLGCFIVVFELLRKKKDKIDFLTGTNFVYFLCFVVAPIYLYTSKENIPPNWIWLYKTPLDSESFLYAGFLSFVGYLMIILGYYNFKKSKLNSRVSSYSQEYFSGITDKQVFKFALVMSFVGLGSFYVYTMALGGVSRMLQIGILLRGNEVSVNSSWMFLKNIAPIVMVSSYFFYALAQTGNNRDARLVGRIMFLCTFFVSMLLLYHQAGRMSFLIYIMTFPLSKIVYFKKLKLSYIIMGVVAFVSLVLFGKQIFNLAVYSAGVSNRVDMIKETGNFLSLLMVEFSFPFASLGNVIEKFSTGANFRYFIDFIQGIMSIIPDSVVSTSNMSSINTVNTEMFNITSSGAVPVDLVSFGYYNFGLAGVMITCFAFGMFMRLLDSLFSDTSTYLASILRGAWMIFIAFRITYAAPKNALVTGFALIVATASLFLFFRYKKGKDKRATKKETKTLNSTVRRSKAI